MPFYRSNYSFNESEIDAVVIDRSPELSDLFRSRKTRVVRIIEEAPVRRRAQEHTREVRFRDNSPSPRQTRRQEQEHIREVHFRDDSPSPPPLRRAPRTRLMPESSLAEGFTPLPPKIKKSSSYDSDDDRGFDIEDRAPKRKSSKSSTSSKGKPGHRRKDSKFDRSSEFIEVPSSPRRPRESDAERARRKQAERDAEHERALRAEAMRIATQNADAAYQERMRREEVEDLGRRFEHAYIEERKEAEAAKARADGLAKQLEKEKREKRYLERKTEILAREKRVAEETERLGRDRPVVRPVDLHQDPRPIISRDPGADAIRRAQEDARRQQQNMRDDDSLFGHQREQRRGRRGSQIIFDDDAGDNTSRAGGLEMDMDTTVDTDFGGTAFQRVDAARQERRR